MCVINATARSRPVARESKAQSQRRWQQRPENENYFRGPENRERVKDWRKRNPGFWCKKRCSIQVPLQEVFQAQAAHNEGVIPKTVPDALQDLFSMQPAVIVGLISIMAGSTLQDDIVATAKELRRKGEDVLGGNVTLNF